MDDAQLDQYRTRLQEQRTMDQALLDEIEVRPADASAHTMESGEAGGAHEAKATRQQDEQANRREAVRQRLTHIDRALQRIDEGSYGTCEVCGAQIGLARLDAVPMSARCREHATVEASAR